jgi:hypothetical protein
MEKTVQVTIVGKYKITEASIKRGDYAQEPLELLAAGKVEEAFAAALRCDQNSVDEGHCGPDELFSTTETTTALEFIGD